MVTLDGTGVWSRELRYHRDRGEIAEAAAELDQLGFRAVWIPDVGGDVLAAVDHLLGAAPRLGVATGILNIWMHTPDEVARHLAGWSPEWRRRFTLGLGVSHAPLIDQAGPGTYARPYSKMVEYLDGLDAAAEPVGAADRLLAALRPRMVELARDRAAGVHPYFVPAEHIARARELLGSGPTIAAELAVVLDPDATTARATARGHTERYLQLPNYTNNLRQFGFGDDDLAGAGSDRLVDAIVAWGDLDAIARRVAEFRQAGADHVCVQVIRPDDVLPREEWRLLADALVG